MTRCLAHSSPALGNYFGPKQCDTCVQMVLDDFPIYKDSMGRWTCRGVPIRSPEGSAPMVEVSQSSKPLVKEKWHKCECRHRRDNHGDGIMQMASCNRCTCQEFNG